MENATPYNIYIENALGDPRKEHGIEFKFYPKHGYNSPFNISKWPEIRKELREKMRNELQDLDKWQNYLLSDRFGERYSVKIGHVYLDNETGEVKNFVLSIRTVEDVNW